MKTEPIYPPAPKPRPPRPPRPARPVDPVGLVRLEGLWFNDAANLADALVVPVWIESTRTWTVPGEVRTYAGGRDRAITSAGSAQTWSPKLGYLPLALAEDLCARAGRVQWVRDPVGGKMPAVFYTPAMTLAGIIDGVQQALVTVTLRSVTHREVG